MSLSTDEIEILCHNLVYQVAYAFYDSPYILVLKLLMIHGVCSEVKGAEILGINPPDLRRYCGILQSHRLIKRHSNKERISADDKSYFRKGASMQYEPGQTRLKEVAYWYIDYREFANVTKYKLAMCHKTIEESTKNQIGQRGYRCPNCHKTFDALQVPNLMNTATGLLYCDQCSHPVDEYDPNATNGNMNGSDERLTRFNNATQPIRDALKSIEGFTVPSLNINSWIAHNVKQAPVPGQVAQTEGEKGKYQVVIGDEGDERERIEKARLAEAQRTQNVLPLWHTHSTVTGSATSLGLDTPADRKDAIIAAANKRNIVDGTADNQQGLAEYYANLVDDEDEEDDDDREPVEAIKKEPVEAGTSPAQEDDDDEMDEMDPSSTATPTGGQVMVMVAGKPKPFEEVTTDDEAYLMTPEEREAYETLMMSM